MLGSKDHHCQVKRVSSLKSNHEICPAQLWICCFWLSLVRLFQFTGRLCPSIHPSFLSTTLLNAARAVGIQLCAFRLCQHHQAMVLQKCCAFIELYAPGFYFEWAQAHVHSLFLCWRLCGWAEALGQTASTGCQKLGKESSCSTSAGQRGVEHFYHVVISSEKSGYEHAQSLDTTTFFNSCFKSCILKKEREREMQPNTVKTWVEMTQKKESEQ